MIILFYSPRYRRYFWVALTLNANFHCKDLWKSRAPTIQALTNRGSNQFSGLNQGQLILWNHLRHLAGRSLDALVR